MVGQIKNSKDTNGTMRYEFSKRLAAMFRMQIENAQPEERFNCGPFVFGTKGWYGEDSDGLGGGGMDFFRMDLDYKGEKFVSNFNMQRVRHVLIPDQQTHGRV